MAPVETPQHAAANQLRLAYISALAVICILIISGQVLVQITLQQEIATHARVAVINDLELRSRRLLRNSLLLFFVPNQYDSALAQIQSDTPIWEQEVNALYKGDAALDLYPQDIPLSSRARLDKERPDLYAMRDAIHTLLKLTEKGHPSMKELAPSVSVIFYKELAAFPAIALVYQDLDKQDSQHVTQIQFIELGLFFLTLCTLVAEFFLVIRPALIRLEEPFIEPGIQ